MFNFLLVDDEKELIDAIADRLHQREYNVNCVYSGKAALDFLGEHSAVDVVVLDLDLPDISGIETLKAIKDRHPLVEVLMLTGHATVPSAVEAMKIGAFDYVLKPCDLEELLEKANHADTRKKDREQKINSIKTKPYISDREREAEIHKIVEN